MSVQTPVFGAYHTTKADPVFLIRSRPQGTFGHLIVADSVGSPGRIRELA